MSPTPDAFNSSMGKEVEEMRRCFVRVDGQLLFNPPPGSLVLRIATEDYCSARVLSLSLKLDSSYDFVLSFLGPHHLHNAPPRLSPVFRALALPCPGLRTHRAEHRSITARINTNTNTAHPS